MFKKLLRLIFPEKCAGCKRLGVALCDSCIDRILLAKDTEDQNVFAVFDYGDSIIRRGIRNLKYYRRSEVVYHLVKKSVPYIDEYISSRLQNVNNESLLLVPIPEYHRNQNLRGFNQSKLIARWLSKEMPNTKVVNLLVKRVATLPQAKIKRNQRLKNLINTMKTVRNVDPKPTYIIIDDVTTTGATFTEAKRALKAGGAKKIICVALAHGYAKK